VEERDERGRVERVDARWWRNARAAAARSARREVRGGDARRRRAHVEVTAPGLAANGSAADVALVDVTARKVSARDDGAVGSDPLFPMHGESISCMFRAVGGNDRHESTGRTETR
jgi:hypothetical protein